MNREEFVATLNTLVSSGADYRSWKAGRPKYERRHRQPRQLKPATDRPRVPALRLTPKQRIEFRRAAYRAAQIVRRAVKAGKLTNLREVEVLCLDCEVNRAWVYDHRDYSKPLDVAAVCNSCNLRRGHARIPTSQPTVNPVLAPSN